MPEPDSENKDWPEDRWPVTKIYANGNVADPSVFDDVDHVDPPEERYLPLQAIRERLEDEALFEDLFCTHQRSDILPRLLAAFSEDQQ